MNYDLSEEQQMLKDAARKFLAKECTGEFIREMEEDEKGYTPDLWKKMVELGWIGLLIPGFNITNTTGSGDNQRGRLIWREIVR